AIDLAVDDESAADAGADGDVEDGRAALAGAGQGFGQAGDVGVVAQHRGPAEEVEDPVGQGKVVPPRDLVRLDYGSRGVVHWSAAADADTVSLGTLQFGLAQQFGYGGENLPANPVRPDSDIHRAAPERGDLAVALAQAKLKLGAANLDTEEHLRQ